ncbi:MAG: acyl-CoA dehydrogenase [Burkholderiales bacterium]|nr:acyl-CoA dehydrogenase [Burkholderiales bacterium]
MLTFLICLVAAAAILLGVAPLRRRLLSDPMLGWFRKVLPQVSQTEQEALDAGTVWWDGDLFSGRPDWKRLLAFPKPTLSAEEQAFMDGPVEEFCAMLDDWEVSHELNDLPPDAWQYIKDRGFLGMIIPKQYGGLGFSALAHSAVVTKLATRSATGTVSVMVPNSLGPAELLLHYGTEAQKNHYLPRLAKGLEMPCFALTGPDAGSDAGSIPDFGIVCHGMHEGREVLGMRVTWEKRYITLGPIATLLGLAFKLYDPDHLLGQDEDVGITLALIPTKHPGVNIGRRHFPLNGSFMNGPNSGKDVFIPMDWVIGGRERVGQGWRMLMECLAAGRSISLPSSSTGLLKLCARATGAYGRIRSQFKTPVARFEGVEEAMARIGGHTYVIDAAREMTAGAVDLGEKPSVVSAIMKYHATERGRIAINDAMDVHGGKGICLGPNNYLGRAYQQIPIGITVEGANILTRSMIIFGQGAIRCHPYVLREIAATREPDAAKASVEFDAALWGHVRFVIANFVRAVGHGITGSVFAGSAGDAHTARYYRQLSRLSAALAFSADVAMLVLGGSLKRREKLSARLGDVLSQLYLASATLKRYEDDGRPEADLPLVHWGLQDCLHRAEEAFAGLVENFPSRPMAWLIRLAAFPLGRGLRAPDDRLGSEVTRLLSEPSAARDRLTRGMFIRKDEADPVGRLEVALDLVVPAEAVEAKLRAAAKAGVLHGRTNDERRASALSQGIITAEEAALLDRFKRVQRACIMVDDFPRDIGRNVAATSTTETKWRREAA